MSSNEFRAEEVVLGMNRGVVRAIREFGEHHHLGAADAREAGRDGVEVPAVAVVALDETFRFAVEVVRRDQEIVRCQSVDPR
jgi:hypothetical protein